MQIIDALFGGNVIVTIIVVGILACLFVLLKGKVRYIIATAAFFYIVGIVFNQQDQIATLIYQLRHFVETVLHIG